MNGHLLITALGTCVIATPTLLLAGIGVASLVARPLSEEAVARWTASCVICGLVAAILILTSMLITGSRYVPLEFGDWVAIPREHFHYRLKFVFDRLSVPFAILTFVLVGTIGAFASRYMHRESGYHRFFLYFAVFLLGMIVASLAGTIETLFLGWELVGLSSALLVAFFHERVAPVSNGQRLWSVYRISDAAFLLAAVALHHVSGSGDFAGLMGTGPWPGGEAALTSHQALAVGLLLLVACAGKSALVPFSGWLPRAMEGPTPSSAVFYGALSVHLGTFLLLRVSPILEASAWLGAAVVAVGLATAVLAAISGRVQTDAKGALAFASLTQVGIITAEIGLGLRYIALIHIIGHACLRTLQLLRAPSLLHDYHMLENAVGGHLNQGEGLSQKWFPGAVRRRLYRAGLLRGQVDEVLDRFAVRPFVHAFRWCDRMERAWTDFLGDTGPRKSDPIAPRADRRGNLMHGLRFPWLTLCVLLPAIGAVRVSFTREPDTARRQSLIVSGLALICALAAWQDFAALGSFEARDRWDPLGWFLGLDLLVVDELSAPELPLAALLYFLTTLATLRTKVREFSFARSLGSEAILLATLSCKLSWGVVALLAAGTVPPYLELRKGGSPRRVYAFHMILFVALLCLGQMLLNMDDRSSVISTLAIVLLTSAVLLRSGVAPVHCWMTDLFEHATFGTALLFVTPMVGVYGVTRFVLPEAPPWVLQAISLASLATAVYAAGMAIVQREARRFFCYLFLSHSSLVLVGLETVTPIGLTGALCLWLSVALSLTGFGLTMRCVEFRIGRVSLSEFHGLYRHVPMLAALFLITGLASIGFPGTAGFVGLELLVAGTVQAHPLVGATVVIVAALNGLAVMQAYFRIFTGKPHVASIDLGVRPAERISVLVLTALIFGGGLYPQPGVTTRYHAAASLAQARARGGTPPALPSLTHPP